MISAELILFTTLKFACDKVTNGSKYQPIGCAELQKSIGGALTLVLAKIAVRPPIGLLFIR